jgi:hypothetical protein
MAERKELQKKSNLERKEFKNTSGGPPLSNEQFEQQEEGRKKRKKDN